MRTSVRPGSSSRSASPANAASRKDVAPFASSVDSAPRICCRLGVRGARSRTRDANDRSAARSCERSSSSNASPACSRKRIRSPATLVLVSNTRIRFSGIRSISISRDGLNHAVVAQLEIAGVEASHKLLTVGHEHVNTNAERTRSEVLGRHPGRGNRDEGDGDCDRCVKARHGAIILRKSSRYAWTPPCRAARVPEPRIRRVRNAPRAGRHAHVLRRLRSGALRVPNMGERDERRLRLRHEHHRGEILPLRVCQFPRSFVQVSLEETGEVLIGGLDGVANLFERLGRLIFFTQCEDAPEPKTGLDELRLDDERLPVISFGFFQITINKGRGVFFLMQRPPHFFGGTERQQPQRAIALGIPRSDDQIRWPPSPPFGRDTKRRRRGATFQRTATVDAARDAPASRGVQCRSRRQ